MAIGLAPKFKAGSRPPESARSSTGRLPAGGKARSLQEPFLWRKHRPSTDFQRGGIGETDCLRAPLQSVRAPRGSIPLSCRIALLAEPSISGDERAEFFNRDRISRRSLAPKLSISSARLSQSSSFAARRRRASACSFVHSVRSVSYLGMPASYRGACKADKHSEAKRSARLRKRRRNRRLTRDMNEGVTKEASPPMTYDRSAVMRAVKSRDTGPERAVRVLLARDRARLQAPSRRSPGQAGRRLRRAQARDLCPRLLLARP